MKIFFALKSGVIRSFKSWKGILVVWLVTLIMAAMVALPLMGAFESGLGSSMITERLTDGIDIEVFSDFEGFGRIVASLGTGLFVIVIVYFLVNAFLTGGLFAGVRETNVSLSFSSFWRASAANFGPFMCILLIMNLLIILLFLIVFKVPFSVLNSGIQEEMKAIKTGLVIFSFFLLLFTIMIPVTDYARAWQVTQEKNRCLRAIGFGFSRTFRTFFSSWMLIIIVLIVQLLYWWLVMKVLPGMKPSTGEGIILFFILSQVMFIIKILLKVYRYGCITSMMELTDSKISVLTPENPPL